MVSTQMVGGYQLHGAAVTVPPNGYTYSDTGMFQDTDGKYLCTSSHRANTYQPQEHGTSSPAPITT
jgi:hypothetical protein